MKYRHEFMTACFPARPAPNRWHLVLSAITVLVVVYLGRGDSHGNPVLESNADLPEISAFLTKPSDRNARRLCDLLHDEG